MTGSVALAVSPHLDDAAFSCGGTLARLASEGWTVIVATLFTRSVADPSGFALACQLDKGLEREVDYMALRRAEDEAAMVKLGCALEWMDFAEAPHRGYESAAALFGRIHPGDRVEPVLREAIDGLLAKHRPNLVMAPQAIGGHVDHVQTVLALTAARPAAPIAWWEDFPYVIRDGDPKQPFLDRFAALEGRCVPLTASEFDCKQAACLAYATQLGFQFGGSEGLKERLAGAGKCERFSGAAVG